MKEKSYFKYGQKEISYLKEKDPKLATIIDEIGMIKREIIPDTFSALIHSIIGQQISSKAHQTIWERIVLKLEKVTPKNILTYPDEYLQSFGLSFRKVEYIKNIAQKISSGELDLVKLQDMSNEEVCKELSKLKGVGKWTAEMIMLFSMQRSNILSYGDLAILRGLRMLYHHRTITPKLHKKYWRRYTPYASVASLYLWAIAGGAIAYMKDYAAKK